MEFSCPACQLPHTFPDDQVPAEGITVACSRCGRHINLDQRGIVQDAPAAPAPAPAPRPPADFDPPGPPSFDPPVLDATHEAPSPGRRPSAQPPQPFGSAAPPPGPPLDVDEPAATMMSEDGSLAAAVAAAEAEARARKPGVMDSQAEIETRALGTFDSAMSEAIEPEREMPSGLAFPGFSPGDTGAWTWRDLPRAFLGVFDARRVLFATAGFWAAIVVFGLLQWVGGLLGGLWGPLGTVFSIVAWLGFVAAFALVASILAYVVQQTIVEQTPSSIKAGVEWTKAWLKSVVGTPVAFVAVIGGVWAVTFIVGLLGRIPVAGPIVWGALSPATILLSFVAGVVGVVFLYSIPLYIPVIYNEKTGPVETLKRLGALFKAHGFRLALYLLLTLVTMGFAWIVVVLPVLTIGTRVGTGGTAAGLGMESFAQIMAGIPNGMGIGLPGAGGAADVPFQFDVAGWLTGIGSAVAPAILLALTALVYYTAGCIIYAIVTGKQKEG